MLGQKLRPGGIAVIKVPNFGSVNRMVRGRKWCGIRLPDHVNYFTRASLTALAKHAGFGISFPFLLSLPTDDQQYVFFFFFFFGLAQHMLRADQSQAKSLSPSPKARSWKPEAGSRKLEAGSRKPEAESWKLKAGS